MPSQKMRLEAEMKDNASPAVRKLREELSNLQATSADTRGVTKLNAELAKLKSEAAADASPAVRKLRAELADLQKSTAENRAVQALTKEIGALKKMSGEVQATAGMKAFGSWFGEAKTAASGVMGVVGGLPGILGAIGIGGIAAGASVADMASEMKRLGEAALDMKELSRETGISLDFINRWSHAGEHFAVGADAMKGALDGFASQLPDFDRGMGNLFKEFSIWPDLVRKMRGESPADALMDALRQAEEVGRTKGPQVQKQILDSIFPGHGGDAERLFGDGGLKGLLDQLQKPWAGPSPDLLAAAKELRDSSIGMRNDFEHLENDIAPGFIKVLKVGVDAVDLVVKMWIWEFDRIADVLGYLGKNAGAGAKAFDDNEKRAVPPPPPETQPPPSLLAPPKKTDPGDWLRAKKASYDGAGPSSGLLQNAAYRSGGTGSGTMEGAIAEGSKSGVLAALREMAIENGLKGGVSEPAGSNNESGGGNDSAAGAGSRGGRRGGARISGDVDEGAGNDGAGRRGFKTRGGHSGGRKGADEDLGDASVAKFHSGKLFEQKAPQVMARLERDFGLNETEAGAVLGNLGHESTGFKAFEEDHGRGPGRGWAQWTDPGRKRRFFEYAQKNHLDPKSDEANYGFLRWELTHTHKSAIAALKAPGSPEQKMMAFERSFEGAGVKAYGSRMKYMRQALAAAHAHPQAADPVVAGSPAPARRADNPSMAAKHPDAHRRADADLSGGRADSNPGSEHVLKIDLRDPAGHVKSTHLKSQGPMRVEMRNRWKTGQGPLVQA